jgi:hypothetical protein
MPEESRSKRDELKTYRELGFSRDRKSEKHAWNKKRILGGEDINHPPVVLKEAEYLRLWKAASAAILAENKTLRLPRETLLKTLHKMIEDRVYEMALESYIIDAAMDQKCEQLGLARWTLGEKKKYLYQEMPRQERQSKFPQYSRYRGALLDDVLSKIESKSRKNPKSLEIIWSETVGETLSRHSQIYRIDEESGILFLRVTNSTMAHHLRQQKAQWWKKLETKLGVNLKKLVIQS